MTRVALVGHAWIADLILSPELSPQALDQPVVPLVVRARAAAPDEQDLPSTCHGDPLHAFVTTRINTHRWPESIPGGGKSRRRPRRASPGTSSIAACSC